MNAVNVKNLIVTKKKITVLDNISFSIKENELCCFLSLDSDSKNALFKALALPNKINNGVIEYFDNIDNSNLEANTLSFMPKKNGTSEHLTVFENLRLMARTRGFSEKEAIELVNEFGIKYDITNRFYDKAKTLSVPLIKKLSFLMTIITDAKIYIFDDPFSNIDVVMKNNFINYLKEIKGKKTIILFTEDAPVAKELADELYIINNNSINHVDKDIELTLLAKMLVDTEVKL